MAVKRPSKAGTPEVAGAQRDRHQPVDLGRALVEAFLTNERINQVLLDILSPEVWRAQPACQSDGTSPRRSRTCTTSGACGSRCRHATSRRRRSSNEVRSLWQKPKTPWGRAPGDGSSDRACPLKRRPRCRFPARRGGSRVRGDYPRCPSPRARSATGPASSEHH